jgi:hypothetical protein
MLLPDVNVYLYAMREESPDHGAYREWLEDRLGGVEPVGVSELVLSAFLRIVTNHRVYNEPTALTTAIEFCRVVLDAPAAVPVRPGLRHWPIFLDLCHRSGARANQVPDAYLAALALESGATMITADQGMHRYAGLRVAHPLGI